MAIFLYYEPDPDLRTEVEAGLQAMGHRGDAFGDIVLLAAYQGAPNFVLLCKEAFQRRQAFRSIRRLLRLQPKPEVVLLSNGQQVGIPRSFEELVSAPLVSHRDTEQILRMVRLL